MTQDESLPKGEARGLAYHLKATLVLGLPLVAAQIVQMLINVTDALMLGWLGVTELAAGTLAFQVLFIVFILGLGFAAALVPLVSSALGQNDETSVRRSTRMSLWLLLLTALVFLFPLSFSRELLLLLGQKEVLADLAQSYLTIAMWSLPPAFLFVALRNFLASVELTRAILWVTIITAVINAFLNYGLIFGNFGFPRLEMQGAAIATVIANTIAFIVLAVYVKNGSRTRHYGIFERLWRPDWPAFIELFRLGLPIAVSIFAEAGLFSAASVMVGWIGTVELAAHGIALQLASLSFMVPLGLSQAASVRVGFAAGQRDRTAVGLAGRSSVLLGLVFGLISALIFLIFPEPLIRLFLEADVDKVEQVVAYAVPLLAVAAAFQMFDSLQIASVSNLRGLKDTKIPMYIATFSYWPIGMSSAYVLAFVFDFGGVGVWAGLVFGLAAAGFWLTWRFSKREQLGLV